MALLADEILRTWYTWKYSVASFDTLYITVPLNKTETTYSRQHQTLLTVLSINDTHCVSTSDRIKQYRQNNTNRQHQPLTVSLTSAPR